MGQRSAKRGALQVRQLFRLGESAQTRSLGFEVHLHEDAEEMHERRSNRCNDDRLIGQRLRTSTIKKAAAPSTGGVICPPVDDAASTAPASGAVADPDHRRIVSEPTVTAFATHDPDSIPNNAEANTLTFAGPPA